MSDIVERLRSGGNDFCADGPCWPGDDMLKAADEITRLRARVEKLEEALADAIRRLMGVIPDSAAGLVSDDELMKAEKRRARAAYGEKVNG